MFGLLVSCWVSGALGAACAEGEIRELLFVGGSVHIQCEVQVEAGQDVHHGEYTRFYRDGQKAEQGRYAQGLRIKRWTEWHDHGVKRATGDYRKGVRSGRWTFWDRSGAKDADRSGDYKSYATQYPSKKPQTLGSLLNGKREGTWRTWWENGRPQLVADYRAGRRQGRLSFWHEDGSFDGEFLSGFYEEGRRLRPLKADEREVCGAAYGPFPEPDKAYAWPTLEPVEPLSFRVEEQMQAGIEAFLGTEGDAGKAAAEALVGSVPQVIPLVLNQWQELDLAKPNQAAVARRFQSALLPRLALGKHASWTDGPADSPAHRGLLKRWRSLWQLTQGLRGYWTIDLRAAFTVPEKRADLSAPPIVLDFAPVEASHRRRRRPQRLAADALAALRSAQGWLIEAQTAEGFWDCDAWDGKPLHDVGVTALAILALTAAPAENSEPVRQQAIHKGVRFLVSVQDAQLGALGALAGMHFIYSHLLGTLALAEVEADLQSPAVTRALREALDFIAKARNPAGAWRYAFPANGEQDSSVTGWALLALQAGQRRGLAVDDQALSAGLAYLDTMTDPETGRVGYMDAGGVPARTADEQKLFPPDKSESLTALALSCRLGAGWDRDDPKVKAAIKLLRSKPPGFKGEGGGEDLYYWFHATRALRFLGGDAWKSWQSKLLKAAVSVQETEGSLAGSFPPGIDPWGVTGGRVYVTALVGLLLGEALAGEV
jgi:hypothetical protein